MGRVDEPHRTYRRQQRRRAIIAWTTAGLAVVLIVLGATFGGEEKRGTVAEIQPFGFSMTTAQYGDLQTGLEEAEFLNRLEQTGSPEDQTPEQVVALFPPHEGELICSYWQIVDRAGQLARVCFDGDGELAQKLERSAFEEPSGVTT
ncbi:MAG: hypothetical protein QOE56_460 [Solirubrobacterales bacterium]|jgi:hypothetical protein|nr:hypothetical protein [Solirubrobacterales bacterium]